MAVKKLKPDDQMPLSIIEEFKNEVKQMASLNNEYIVKLIGVCVDSAGEKSFQSITAYFICAVLICICIFVLHSYHSLTSIYS